MALGTNHVTTTTAATFIPELWSDEVIAAYKQNLILGNHVTRINHSGKKGDVIHIPAPTRGAASAKAASTQVNLIAATESEKTVTVNKHYEYSRLIEDIADVQALSSLRRFYTDDAGYALAKQIDQDIFTATHTMQGGSQWDAAVNGAGTVWDGTASSNAGNALALTDAGLRTMAQTLDDADVPMEDRILIIPPVEKNSLLGIARFTEQAYTGEIGGGNGIRNGLVGDIYGMKVYVSTNCPWAHLDSGDGDDYFDFSSAAATTGTDITGESVTIGAGGAAAGRVGLMIHKDALALATQVGIRSQTQYKQEYLGDLFTADTLYGTGELRDDACVPFIVAD